MPVTLHIRPQADPDYIMDTLLSLADQPQSQTELQDRLASLGHPPGTFGEQRSRLTALGLGGTTKNDILLTDLGRTAACLAGTRPSVYHDFMHFRHYSLWSPTTPNESGFSWTYRAICNELWAASEMRVETGRLAELVSIKAVAQFGDAGSVGTATSRGVLTWLRKLDPSVMEGDKAFRLRSICSVELVLQALDMLHLEYNLPFGELISLDGERRTFLAQACLVSSSSISFLLDEVVRRFDWVERQSGWGDFLRVRRQCNLTDFLLDNHV